MVRHIPESRLGILTASRLIERILYEHRILNWVRIPPTAGARFHNVREAKEFLASEIVEEANREGAPLSEIEGKMLYFSEVGWTLPGMMQISDEFDRRYDQGDYEKKISQLIKNLDKRLRKETPAEYQDWRPAIKFLKWKDHYINVMIHQVVVRPHGDRLKLWTTGLVVAINICVGGILDTRYHLDLERFWPSKETISKLWFSAWTAAVVVAVLYTFLRIILGPQRMADTTNKILFKMFGTAQPDSED
jgi:hypothetical protein